MNAVLPYLGLVYKGGMEYEYPNTSIVTQSDMAWSMSNKIN